MCKKRCLASKVISALVAAACLQTVAFAQQGFPTLPSSLDARVQVEDNPHYSWVPTSARALGQLVLFLPGTGGKPKISMPFLKLAASLGYHVISLAYQDSIAAQEACSRNPDENAYITFRMAIFRGGDFGKFHVDRQDSIEERLTRLLAHLKSVQPSAGWEQFLTPSGGIDWSKIVVSGQSQGGGHAYIIAKYHLVARVITFGSPKDYSFYYHRPAKGFDGDTKTPLNRFFAFNHVRDNRNGCNHDQQLEIFKAIGLDKLGIADADKHEPAFNHAHLIYTNVEVKGDAFHGAPLNGVNTIIGQTPEELLYPVWTYMLTEPIGP